MRHRIDIDGRPSIFKQRTRLYDYEGDIIVVSAHKGVIITMADRCTREIKLAKAKSKSADHVSDACIVSLKKRNRTPTQRGKEIGHPPYVTNITAQLESPREFRRVFSVSHAVMTDS